MREARATVAPRPADPRARAQGRDLAVALASFTSRHAQLAPERARALGPLPGALGGAAEQLRALAAAAQDAGRWAAARACAARDAADARATADAATAARAGAVAALACAERTRPRLRSAVAELCAAAAAAARQCRAAADAHERTAAGLQAGIPRELALAPEHWLSSAARAPLRLAAGGPVGAPGVLAAALGAPGDAAAIPPPLAAAVAAADREGAALLARRDKAAHAAVAALQVAPARARAGAGLDQSRRHSNRALCSSLVTLLRAVSHVLPGLAWEHMGAGLPRGSRMP